MYLRSLKISQFKNYVEADLDLSPKINCFIGNNGEGKTNLLDAIYYLSFCKSYFSSLDSQNILHNHDFFAIHGWYSKEELEEDKISCLFRKSQRKQFKLNDKEYDRLADHIGLYPLVMVSPYDRDLINEGSDARRRFIDTVISQFDKTYLNDLINYNKALAQRNACLKNAAESGFLDRSLLELWDEQMAPLANSVFKARQNFIEDFSPMFHAYFEMISDGKESVDIVYQSGLHDKTIHELFNDAVEKDRVLKFTTVGVHKDDLNFQINSYPVKRFGSQGQQKSFVIALKLAQFEYTRNKMGYKPILLFDDIFDKLDDLRVEQLIKLVSNNSFGQVFITDTQQERIKRLLEKVDIDHKIFRVEQGNAVLMSDDEVLN